MAALPLLLLPLLWLLLVRPQQRRVRAQQAMVRSLEVGDDILTSAGIYGTIVALDDEVATLEVAAGVHLRIARMAIGRRLNAHVDDRPDTEPGRPTENGGEADRRLLPPPMEEQ